MHNVITDTSCLIVLSNIGQLDILHGLYKTISITPEVAAEFGEVLPEWIQAVPVTDPQKIRMLRNNLELGEASAITLAIETPDPLLILDDRKARHVAADLGLPLTGTLGIIAKAYRTGLIADITGVMAYYSLAAVRRKRTITMPLWPAPPVLVPLHRLRLSPGCRPVRPIGRRQIKLFHAQRASASLLHRSLRRPPSGWLTAQTPPSL